MMMIANVDRVMMIVKDEDRDDDCNVDQVKEKLAESEADSGRSSKSSSELENKMSRNKRGREEENLQVRGYCDRRQMDGDGDHLQVMEREESFSSLLPKPTTEYGSFFLRLGTVIAGIGALIYSGIEVGDHLEKELVHAKKCATLLLLAVRPATQVIFILLQTYFLFLNNRMNLYKRKGASRLGLVHLAATNLCIWLKELIHEVAVAADAGGDVTMMEMEVNLEGEEMNMTSTNYTRPASSCFEEDRGILGNLRMDSMDYLFPLLAQYCVISAAILLVIWNQVRLELSIVLVLMEA